MHLALLHFHTPRPPPLTPLYPKTHATGSPILPTSLDRAPGSPVSWPTMKITPKPGIISRLTGPVGHLRFSKQPSGHVVRRKWSISVPPSAAQVSHRAAVACSYSLYCSLPADLLIAWDLHSAPLNYSRFCDWGHYNIGPLSTGTPSCLCPHNPDWHKLYGVLFWTAHEGQIDVQWQYGGTPGTGRILMFCRPLPSCQWTLYDTVNADLTEATYEDLDPSKTYECALVLRNVAKTLWDKAEHDILDPGQPLIWTPYYPNSYGCSACHWGATDPATDALVYPRAHSYTQPELDEITTMNQQSVDRQNEPPPPWTKATHSLRFMVHQHYEAIERIHFFVRWYNAMGHGMQAWIRDWKPPEHFDEILDASLPGSPGWRQASLYLWGPAKTDDHLYVAGTGCIHFRVSNNDEPDWWTKIDNAYCRVEAPEGA
ncbi:hypothetical protein ES703_27571 [subsurface metagenome]